MAQGQRRVSDERRLHRLCARLVQCCYTTRGRDWHERRLERHAAIRRLGHTVLAETTDPAHGVQLCLVAARGHTILVVPGSNEWRDHLRNLRCFPLRVDPDGYWHNGFDAAARMIYGEDGADPEAVALVREATVITGHSFGAAVSQRLAVRLWRGEGRRLPHVNFASPKTCWLLSPPDHDDHVINFCRTDDRVCRLPRGHPFGPWHHVGKVAWLAPPCRHPGEDHGIERYLALLP